MFQNIHITDLIIILASIVVSMGLHEAVHGLVAHRLGDTTAAEAGRLTLNPLKHIDIMTTVLLPLVMLAVGLPPLFVAKPVPLNPLRIKYDEFGVAVVALAGPLTNLSLAVLASVILKLTIGVNNLAYYNVLQLFIAVNIGFFVFNMIPIPPLDGSRLLYAFAPDPLRRVMEAIEAAGLMVIVIVVVVFLPLASSVLNNIQNSLFTFLLSW